MAVWRRKEGSWMGWSATPMPAGNTRRFAYTDRLAEVGAAPSIGSVGDSYDNPVWPSPRSGCSRPN